jgi:hypothetical protein
MNNEEIVQQTLTGDLNTAKWAIPRVVKIFVSATRAGMYEWFIMFVALEHTQKNNDFYDTNIISRIGRLLFCKFLLLCYWAL